MPPIKSQSGPQNHLSLETLGLLYGFIGVFSFSLTLPATRAAVAEFDPILVGLGRGVFAAILAAIVLRLTHQLRPSRHQLQGLAVVAIGVVLGFPLLSAWAMQRLPAAHGAVVLGVLPLATAIAGVLRAGDRPTSRFWIASAIGSATVVSFGIWSGAGSLQGADLALLAAVVAAAFGYAEGGRLAQKLGGWQVICWALVIAAPFEAIPMAVLTDWSHLTASTTAWIGFAYVILVSQFLGFFAWYHGLSIGGVARVGQIQLLQPFLTILASALLLGETITPVTVAAACLVMLTVAIGRRSKINKVPVEP